MVARMRPQPLQTGEDTVMTEQPSPIEIENPIIEAEDIVFSYGGPAVLHGVNLQIPENRITAIIGPSGCGKSTFLRLLNRMHDFVPGASVQGQVRYRGQDLYDPAIDPVEVRRRIGMVFQKPNPFPKSIYDNMAFGPRRSTAW